MADSEDSYEVDRLIKDLREWKHKRPEPPKPVERSKPSERLKAYWAETAKLLGEYLELHVGAQEYSQHRDEFWAWVGSPDRAERLLNGDDMARATLVDQYLREARQNPPAARRFRKPLSTMTKREVQELIAFVRVRVANARKVWGKLYEDHQDEIVKALDETTDLPFEIVVAQVLGSKGCSGED